MTKSYTLRLTEEMFYYFHQLSEENSVSISDVIFLFLRVGMENKVDVNKKLDDMRKTIIEQSKYEMATLEIKQLMRKNYLVENFEKLARLIRNNNSIEVEEKKKIYSAMEKRIVDLWGEDSPQHKSVKGWMDFNVPKKQK